MKAELPRRGLLAGIGAALVCDALAARKEPLEGRIVGASHARGHWLRGGAPELRAGETRDVDVAIVGGGVAGLGAAWRLRAAGLSCEVLELEPRLGGTSSYGDDGAVPYPWGAHYLAAPNPEARAPLRLLDEMGVLVGWDAAGRPRFDPKVLCHSPQERLFVREGKSGSWFDGLSPVDVMTDEEEEELRRFHDLEDELTRKVGRDGRPAFTIPIHFSSRDPELLALDRISFAEHLDRLGFRTPFVRWYLRYATLDDFGAEPEHTSAWAGLHYFASRKLKTPELAGSHFLVWPEGNGRLVRELADRSGAALRTEALCLGLRRERERTLVSFVTPPWEAAHVLRARGVVLAVPAFVARRLAPDLAERFPVRPSSPWLVANLHGPLPPEPNRAWDSVLKDAEGLGYVDAGHQRTRPEAATVLTYYRAFGGDPASARADLEDAGWRTLARSVLADLAPAHPDLGLFVDRVDVMLWGHAMPRPVPGFLGDFADPRPLVGEALAWAHSDQTGVALFEEALTRGVAAAEALATGLGARGPTWL